jgi:hypothetical protein
MDYEAELAAASEANEQARQAVLTMERERAKAVEEARAKVYADFAERDTRLRTAFVEASYKLSEVRRLKAEHDASSNPLVGRKVECMRKKGSSWYSYNKPEPHFGVIEVITPNSEQPANRYNCPVGTLAVRLLKADGKPGKKVERLDHLRDSEHARGMAEKYGDDNKEAYLQRWWALVD